MSTQSRALMWALAATAVSVALSACSATTGGTPERSAYSGPERSQDRATSASGLAPGIDITLGEGDSRAVCTAGWIVESDNRAFLLTAGHCAVSGDGTKVYFGNVPEGGNVVLDREDTFLGEVSSTSYAEPYTPDNIDIAQVELINSVVSGGEVYVTPSIGGRVNVLAPLKDIKSTVGNRVCWYSNASKFDTIGAKSSCGKVSAVSADQSKVLVTPDEGVELDPQMAGAPATVSNGKVGAAEKVHALGVFTDVYKDHVVIDNVGPILEKSGTSIVGAK